MLTDPVVNLNHHAKNVIIFHCEFSSVRAPTMCKYLRDLDQFITFGKTDLIFPELYVMQKGYERFFDKFPTHCTPHQYIRMKDKYYAKENDQCEHILSRSREEAQQNRWQQNGTVQTLTELVRTHGLGGLKTIPHTRPGSPTAGQRPTEYPSTPKSQIIA